jgi:hypothetical protein
MKFSSFFVLFIAVCSNAYSQESGSTSISVSSPKAFVLKCEGTTGNSRVTAWASNSQLRQVLTHQLDDDDDCSQAVWTKEKFGPDNSSTLVMVNPGRMGVNAQWETFLVDKDKLSYAGNVPVSADKVNKMQYRSYVSEPGSEWERTYEIYHGKFSVSKELRLVRDDALCVGKLGDVQGRDHCTTKMLVVRPAKPVCIEYDGNIGKLKPIDACSRLTSR